MPYPFMKLPTFGEIRKVLKEKYDCQYINDGEDTYFL